MIPGFEHLPTEQYIAILEQQLSSAIGRIRVLESTDNSVAVRLTEPLRQKQNLLEQYHAKRMQALAAKEAALEAEFSIVGAW
jgi:hypothetical protein